jgi:hypothetical protein
MTTDNRIAWTGKGECLDVKDGDAIGLYGTTVRLVFHFTQHSTSHVRRKPTDTDVAMHRQ